MFAIKCQRQIWYSQRELRDLLGIAASTLSRMIDALVDCGYLLRRRDPEDGRRNQLRLTLIGRRAVAYSFRTFVKSGLAELVFGRGLTDSLDGSIASIEDQGEAMFQAEGALHTIHLNFGKREAYFEYADREQPRPIGRIDLDPTIDLWDNDELPILKYLVAVVA
jgi:DNA-binding MarR family transcriptional regulator